VSGRAPSTDSDLVAKYSLKMNLTEDLGAQFQWGSGLCNTWVASGAKVQ
jgi:hypothetical protein